MISLDTQSLTSVTASFLASLVEFVEALTIVLAVGTTRGWRSALTGVFLGIFSLIILVIFFAGWITVIPLRSFQLIVGALLLLFGMRWLRKAILRFAGVIPLHDEEKIFAAESAKLRQNGRNSAAYFGDPVALITSYKAVLLEGIEVVFIVVAIGVGHLGASIAGAVLAGLLVVLVGFLIHGPLTRVPENYLKFSVGILLSAFGTFWVGEGLNYDWPGADLIIFALIPGFLVFSYLAIYFARRSRRF